MSVVVITGCSSGFGLEIAVGFATRGDTVVATMRNLEKADALEARLAIEDARAEVRRLDVADAASRAELVEGVLRDLGQIDVLVNNAGLGQLGPAEELDEGYHRQMFETNYWGAYEMMRLVLPGMRARRSGRIVNLTSVGAVSGAPWMGAYCATKHALDAMSASLDIELKGFGIRVVSVLPGPYPTSLIDNILAAPAGEGVYGEYFTGGREGLRKRMQRRPDLSPVVEAVIEAAGAPEPPIRTVVGVTDATEAAVAAKELDHLVRRGDQAPEGGRAADPVRGG